MNLHTRIFNIKLGLILWCAVLALWIIFLITSEQYFDVAIVFVVAAISDLVRWGNKNDTR